jgi:hypothetical protein
VLDGPPIEVFSKHQKIQAAGLDLPFSLRLVMALKKRGLNLAEDTSLAELKETLCSW